jgi:hypothetical protein
LHGPFFDSEEGNDRFFRNTRSYSPNCRALYPRKWISLYLKDLFTTRTNKLPDVAVTLEPGFEEISNQSLFFGGGRDQFLSYELNGFERRVERENNYIQNPSRHQLSPTMSITYSCNR